MRSIPAYALAVATLVTGCATQPYVIQNPFDANEAAWSQQSGNALVKGQAFLKTRGGDVKTCAGNPVTIVPKTRRSTEMQAAFERGVNNFANAEVRPGFGHTTRCDAQGNFTFANLPAGDWYVRTAVVWEAPGKYVSFPQGGVVTGSVTTHPGQTSDLIVTR